MAFILGLGYVMGLRVVDDPRGRAASLSNFVLVPLIFMIGSRFPEAVYPATIPIGQMDASQIFRGYVRYIGVGAIATAGIFGIIKSLRVIAGSFSVAAKAFRAGGEAHGERTDRDMSIVTHPGRRGHRRDRRGDLLRHAAADHRRCSSPACC